MKTDTYRFFNEIGRLQILWKYLPVRSSAAWRTRLGAAADLAEAHGRNVDIDDWLAWAAGLNSSSQVDGGGRAAMTRAWSALIDAEAPYRDSVWFTELPDDDEQSDQSLHAFAGEPKLLPGAPARVEALDEAFSALGRASQSLKGVEIAAEGRRLLRRHGVAPLWGLTPARPFDWPSAAKTCATRVAQACRLMEDLATIRAAGDIVLSDVRRGAGLQESWRVICSLPWISPAMLSTARRITLRGAAVSLDRLAELGLIERVTIRRAWQVWKVRPSDVILAGAERKTRALLAKKIGGALVMPAQEPDQLDQELDAAMAEIDRLLARK